METKSNQHKLPKEKEEKKQFNGNENKLIQIIIKQVNKTIPHHYLIQERTKQPIR